MTSKPTKPTHWMVRDQFTTRPYPTILLNVTEKSFSYLFVNDPGRGMCFMGTKLRSMKHAHPDMRFFTDELSAIDYLASLMIRESEVARQKMVAWEDDIRALKLLRNECVAKTGAA